MVEALGQDIVWVQAEGSVPRQRSWNCSVEEGNIHGSQSTLNRELHFHYSAL